VKCEGMCACSSQLDVKCKLVYFRYQIMDVVGVVWMKNTILRLFERLQT